jgi:YD repeat-containing protein
MTEVDDSIAGTITHTYDLRDRLTSETTPEGSVSYTYDAVSRRASMTVAGQTAVTYAYDDASRLETITQRTSTVSFGYDDANRRTSLTLPNGIEVSYTYVAASICAGHDDAGDADLQLRSRGPSHGRGRDLGGDEPTGGALVGDL